MPLTDAIIAGSTPVAITVQSPNGASKVTIRENATTDTFTSDFTISSPTSGNFQAYYVKGLEVAFGSTFSISDAARRPIYPYGTVLGYLTAVTGTPTFHKLEEP
jgi:hypothetical protein